MNTKYNGLDFIKSNIPDEPLLRFKGNNIEEFEKWSHEAKEKLKEIMGFDRMKRAESGCCLIESKEFDGYIREKYKINTLENMEMPFYVLKSKEANNGKAVIAIHGHGSDGKEGLVGNEAESYKNSIEKFSYTYAFEFMDKGYTVYIPDLLGAGERTLGIYKDNTAECNDINNALISLGMSLQGIILFENMCLVEHISNEGFKEINCCGFSGGGHSALWLAVMCDKINRAIVSGFFHSFKDTLIYNNRCGCNFMPDQWLYADMGDILAMAAPKEIYIETGNADKLNGERGINGVYEQLEIADKCYKLFGKKIEINVCDGAHKWYGSFMDRF